MEELTGSSMHGCKKPSVLAAAKGATSPDDFETLPDRTTQERLINWGYAICDTAMRTWVVRDVTKPAALPFDAAA